MFRMELLQNILGLSILIEEKTFILPLKAHCLFWLIPQLTDW